MAEQINDRKVFTLLEVTQSIRKTLKNRYSSAFWVKAEMIRLNHYPHSGHCYPDLVEKQDGQVVAQLRANLWRDDYERINGLFESSLQEPLKDGIKILFLAKIGFDPQYGLSLHIRDIDPTFTLGDLEQEKQRSIGQLKKQKLFYKNKSLPLALLPHRLAVISAETSKGFADFKKVIDPNPFGYRYFYHLFPALLQGDQAVGSIVKALERIRKVRQHFDMVVILRGGGADLGLSCYNHFDLARAVADFPLPVVTGIGHATNETVVEMVAHLNCITPTQMAEWLLQRSHAFAVPVEKARTTVLQVAGRQMQQQRERFAVQVKDLKKATLNRLQLEDGVLSRRRSEIGQHSRFLLKAQQEHLLQIRTALDKGSAAFLKLQHRRLDHTGRQVQLMDPQQVLKRGYSIAYAGGQVVTSATQLHKDLEMEIRFADGRVKSRVTAIEKNKDE